MKVNISKLKRIIRETIKEVATPGDERYSMPGDARGGVPGRSRSRGVTFPGHDDGSTIIRKGFDDDEQAEQSLSTASGEYVDGVGWVIKDKDEGELIDDNMKDGGRSENEFLLVIDSQVTRGKAGEIRHPQSNNSFSVQEDTTSGTLAGDLYWCFQKSGSKSAKNRAIDVLEVLMKNDLLAEATIDDQLIEEFGIKGKDSNKFYGIVEYFSEYNSGLIREAKKRARILKRKRTSRI